MAIQLDQEQEVLNLRERILRIDELFEHDFTDINDSFLVRKVLEAQPAWDKLRFDPNLPVYSGFRPLLDSPLDRETLFTQLLNCTSEILEIFPSLDEIIELRDGDENQSLAIRLALQLYTLIFTTERWSQEMGNPRGYIMNQLYITYQNELVRIYNALRIFFGKEPHKLGILAMYTPLSQDILDKLNSEENGELLNPESFGVSAEEYWPETEITNIFSKSVPFSRLPLDAFFKLIRAVEHASQKFNLRAMIISEMLLEPEVDLRKTLHLLQESNKYIRLGTSFYKILNERDFVPLCFMVGIRPYTVEIDKSPADIIQEHLAGVIQLDEQAESYLEHYLLPRKDSSIQTRAYIYEPILKFFIPQNTLDKIKKGEVQDPDDVNFISDLDQYYIDGINAAIFSGEITEAWVRLITSKFTRFLEQDPTDYAEITAEINNSEWNMPPTGATSVSLLILSLMLGMNIKNIMSFAFARFDLMPEIDQRLLLNAINLIEKYEGRWEDWMTKLGDLLNDCKDTKLANDIRAELKTLIANFQIFIQMHDGMVGFHVKKPDKVLKDIAYKQDGIKSTQGTGGIPVSGLGGFDEPPTLEEISAARREAFKRLLVEH